MKADLRAIDERRAENLGMGQREITEIVCQGHWETRCSPSEKIGLRHRKCRAAICKEEAAFQLALRR